jgi:asparagine synthase (glutamine-hydrolysing)
MCGFIFYLNKKKIDAKKIKQLKKAVKLIKHRGPDYNENFSNDKIFAHHCRLSIQDLKVRSKQPFFSKDKRYMLLFNGEIYNFKILRKKLINKYNFITSSDTEVVLAAYLIYGDKFLNKINGMFSILIYDFKLNKFLISRDPFGQKPLYYYHDKDSFIVCSEIKPIQQLKKLKIDKNELKDYFIENNFAYRRKTIIQKIYQLKAGEYGKFDKFNRKNPLQINNYFSENDLKFSHNKKSNILNPLKVTIKKHLISDAKIGVAISSGLDSRSICAILSLIKQNKKIIKAYFVEFKNYNLEKNEVLNFCKNFKIKLEIIEIKPKDIIEKFETCIRQNESPLGGIMNIGLFKLCEKAKKDKIKVILGGYGLDEALGGYDILNPNNFSNRVDKTNRLIDGTVLDNSKMILRRKQKHKSNKKKFILNDKSIHQKQIDLLFQDKIPRTLHMVDRFSMSNSIEFRNPYIDSDFVKKCLQIPKKKYFFKKIGKMPVRNTLKTNFKGYDYWFDKKKSVQSPQADWFREKNIKSWINKIFKQRSLYTNNSFLNKKEINKYWENFQNKKINFSLPILQIINLYYLNKIFKN